MSGGRPGFPVAYALTAATAATMATVSAVGVFATDWLYRDNMLITATFRGQDMVTLVVAVPLLLLGLVWEMRGSLRGRVLWLGMLFYAMYGYLFYAVAAAFNQFFLLYVATFGLPLYALLFSVHASTSLNSVPPWAEELPVSSPSAIRAWWPPGWVFCGSASP